ncbi:hypothetical protein U1Q18_028415 [Sarracenia purpurea var. burkii]
MSKSTLIAQLKEMKTEVCNDNGSGPASTAVQYDNEGDESEERGSETLHQVFDETERREGKVGRNEEAGSGVLTERSWGTWGECIDREN